MAQDEPTTHDEVRRLRRAVEELSILNDLGTAISGASLHPCYSHRAGRVGALQDHRTRGHRGRAQSLELSDPAFVGNTMLLDGGARGQQ